MMIWTVCSDKSKVIPAAVNPRTRHYIVSVRMRRVTKKEEIIFWESVIPLDDDLAEAISNQANNENTNDC